MKMKVFVLLFSIFFVCQNCFGGDLERKFEQMLKAQKEADFKIKSPNASDHWLEQKIKELSEIKVVSLKKIGLPSFDRDSYYAVSWCYSYNPKIIYTNLYELSDEKLLEQTFVWMQGTKTGIKSVDTDSDYIFDIMDYAIPLFLRKPNFHANYYDSNFYFQCEADRVENTLTYVKDIDGDGNDEILSFCWMGGAGGGEGDYRTGIFIYKYVNREWKKVLYAPFFGWKYFFDDENYKKEEWYQPKPFPYDFMEYKGKVGLRIVCYDLPRERPTHYHAQFWAYNEAAQEYKKIEEVWESIERTPADGLIFADAPDFLPVPWPKFSMLGARLSAADLAGMDKAQLRLLRNAVYARHGRMFASADLQTLFGGQIWYRPNPDYSDDLLTETDKANIALIQEFEKK